MIKIKKNFLKTCLTTLTILLLPVCVNAQSPLCSYKGPDTSNDGLKLTAFSVDGNANLQAGDMVTVKFDLQNNSQQEIKLSDRGIFIYVQDPSGGDASFGFAYTNTTLQSGQTVSIDNSTTLDQAGTWTIWPSYDLGKTYGPDQWHVCTLSVAAGDADNDGIPDDQDNCPQDSNKDQSDSDNDSVGDTCDNCPKDSNENQSDSDSDTIGDACDNCPQDSNENQSDSDSDTIGDACDNCPQDSNQDQADMDSDGTGDACDQCDDRDDDNDGIKNCDDQCPDDAEDLDGYQDNDGCPESDDEPAGDNETELSISQSPKSPVLGDRIHYLVRAIDKEEVAFIEIWTNEILVRKCIAATCDYITPPIEEEPEFGVAVVDMRGNIVIEGDGLPDNYETTLGASITDLLPEYPPEVMYVPRDDDEDGIGDICDNCPGVYNPYQEDWDHDAVGNACDSCFGSSFCEAAYCCERFYSPCKDGISRWSVEFMRDIYYWEDFYDFIMDTGCGCYDSDGGRNPYKNGMIYNENVTMRTSSVDPPPGAPLRFETSCNSQCETVNEDWCSADLTQLHEYSCTSEGIQSETVTCPGGCQEGACICQDTDDNWDYYNRGSITSYYGDTSEDYCIDENRLREYGCHWDGESLETINHVYRRDVTCPYGCVDGACKCIDSDDGRYYDVPGNIGRNADYCLDNRTLVEYYTDWVIGEKRCTIESENHTCEGLCNEGRCLPPTCDDKVLNQGEEDIDCGGPCDLPCDLCQAYRDSDIELPTNFFWGDWRGRNWMTSVKDQSLDLSCGSCWAMASVGTMEAMYNIEHDEVMDPELDLSEQYLVADCGLNVYDCDGGTVTRALRFVRDDGISDEECYPYLSQNSSCGRCSDWSDRLWTIDSYDRLGGLNSATEIKELLLCNGPVPTCGDGHCVIIAGWRGNRWIIKNSWTTCAGICWNDNGFREVSYDHRWVHWKYALEGVHER